MTTGTKAQSSDQASTYFLGSHNTNIDLMDANTTEKENARNSTVNGTNYASIDARLEAIETAIAAAVAGSGNLVSSNDTTPGYLNGKIVAGEGVGLTEGNDGGDETLTIDAEQAVEQALGLAFFQTMAF